MGAPAKAAAKPAAAAAAKPAEPKHGKAAGCNPGEVLMPDGRCEFTAETLHQR